MLQLNKNLKDRKDYIMKEITDGIFPEMLALEIEIKDKGMNKHLKALALLLIGVAIGRATRKEKGIDIDELPKTMDCHQKSNLGLKTY